MTNALTERIDSAPGAGIPDAYSKQGLITGALGKTVAGTTYTIGKTDNGKTLNFTNGSAVAVTVPTGLGVDFVCGLVQVGTGAVSFSGSVTINGGTQLATQYACGTLYAYAADIFVLSGNIS